jgi:putative ABC transport system permease protein
MRWWNDLVALSAAALRASKRRTLLSLLGVAIGVAAVLVLTALGDGARGYVHGQFAALGANLIAVLPGKTETSGGLPGFGGTPNDLTLEDAEALRRGLPELSAISPMSLGNETFSHRERSRQVIVIGAGAAMQELRDLRVRAGRYLPDVSWDRGSPVAVIGSKLAEELFPGESAVGAVARLGAWRMRIIGVLEPQGTHLGMDMDETVFVPVATGLRMFNQHGLFRVLLGARAYADMEAVERRTIEILRERHGEEDFTLITQDAVLGSLGSILRMLTLALAGIAAISLSVAGIGIMNVMLVAVSERTAEIGLLKAIGAAPRQILSLFLCEAVLLSAFGGLCGLAVGQGLVRLLRNLWPAFPAHTPIWAVGSALCVSVFVGVLFGVMPARRAMRLDPVVALSGRDQ